LTNHLYYDWTALIDSPARDRMASDIKRTVAEGKYWTNSPPYQTNINIFGLPSNDWVNLKMSFLWSCFAYLQKEVQIKSVKSWGYMTNLSTETNRDNYWHNHIRPDAQVLSGVFYLRMPENINLDMAGTEFAPNGVEDPASYHFAPARIGNWIIWPGKEWHRPGILQSQQDRFIVAADMEF
jgi:hypothetical protein